MTKKSHIVPKSVPSVSVAENFLHRALVHVTGALGLLISISFFTATFDTAQVKLTFLHMGTLFLATLWTTLQIERKRSPFTKRYSCLLLPFFVYIGWNILCYIFAPLHAEATEEFIRFILYSIITLLVASEFDFSDIKAITKWIFVAVCISFSYAFLQILDGFFPNHGLDPMPWHGFFTKRVFSTHANPNFYADFVIFSSCILGGVYASCRQKKYLVWLCMGLISLFFTESKGAWIAYVITATLGIFLYTNYLAPFLQRYRLKINVLALVAVIGVTILAGFYTAKRFQSVSFRTHTWSATLEMITDHPIMGVGIGNFKTMYTAYRHPQIFYIENAHNVETQHAENELLEQGATSGVVGAFVFLWLLYSLFMLALRTLRHATPSTETKCYLLGYTTALAGILIHSLVDISIHFASSGFFLALFIGIIISFNRPEENFSTTPPITQSFTWIGWIERLILVVGLLALIKWLLGSFYEITSSLGSSSLGEIALIFLSWIIFVSVLLSAGWIVLRSAWLVRSTALIPLYLLVPLEMVAYCPFQANHYYSLAITLNRLGNAEESLAYFTKAVQFNPFQAEYRQFRANVLNVVFNLDNSFSPARGDQKTPSNDYDRARNDYAVVEQRSPNHPLLHHNKGQLFYKMALIRSDQSAQAKSDTEHELFKREALQNMDQAKRAFERSLQADPTLPETYLFLAQIGLLENNLEQAQAWLDKFKQGPKGVTEPEFLARHQNYPPAEQLQAQVNARRNQLFSRREK